MTQPVAKTESNVSHIIRGTCPASGDEFDINTQTGLITLTGNTVAGGKFIMSIADVMEVAAAYVRDVQLKRLALASAQEVLFGPFEELIRSMSLNPLPAPVTTSEAEGQ